jgi:NADH-quinone oxidoreductase subunit L
MMALSGVPIFFSGFWSKDEILHAAHGWSVSRWPFWLGVFGALLTAFYMTRQVYYVFFGANRGAASEPHGANKPVQGAEHQHAAHSDAVPHESPGVMTVPLIVLAACTVFLGFIGTPAWPWFQSFLNGETAVLNFSELKNPEIFSVLKLSTVIVTLGIGLGWWLYGRKPIQKFGEEDVLERMRPDIFGLLKNKFYFDEIYQATIIPFNAWWAQFCDDLDYWVWNGAVLAVSYLVLGLAWVNRVVDEYVVNLGFDEGCRGISRGGRLISHLQSGRVQNYLRVIGVALVALLLLLMWGCRAS